MAQNNQHFCLCVGVRHWIQTNLTVNVGWPQFSHQRNKDSSTCHAVFVWLAGIHSVKVLVAQLYPTLCDPMDCSSPGSSAHGILQARMLEWVAISFSGDLSNPRIAPGSPALQGDSLPSEPPGKPNIESGTQSKSVSLFLYCLRRFDHQQLHLIPSSIRF